MESSMGLWKIVRNSCCVCYNVHTAAILCLASCVTLVPSGLPLNITATTISSSKISVSWETLPAIDNNGIITEYEVQYNQTVAVESHPPTASVMVPANQTTVVLTGLGAGLQYSVTVRAFTVQGPGPFSSDHVTAETDPDGMISSYHKIR